MTSVFPSFLFLFFLHHIFCVEEHFYWLSYISLPSSPSPSDASFLLLSRFTPSSPNSQVFFHFLAANTVGQRSSSRVIWQVVCGEPSAALGSELNGKRDKRRLLSRTPCFSSRRFHHTLKHCVESVTDMGWGNFHDKISRLQCIFNDKNKSFWHWYWFSGWVEEERKTIKQCGTF